VPTLHDKRLTGLSPPGSDDKPHYEASLDYSIDRVAIADEAAWRVAIEGQPLSAASRCRQTARMMYAKLVHVDAAIQIEGLHGLWELCVQQCHHADVLSDGASGTALCRKLHLSDGAPDLPDVLQRYML
jgi:hypothetical protein